MICVQLRGGLGNQMFQYACGRALALKNNSDLCLDCSNLVSEDNESNTISRNYELGVFNIQERVANENDLMECRLSFRYRINIILNKFLGLPIFFSETGMFEKEFNRYNKNIEKMSDHAFLIGYWQSERYFKTYESFIRNDFRFKLPLEGRNLELANQMINCNSVGLHVRRGDYISNATTFNTHGTCSLDYYRRAINIIIKQVREPIIFVFSDDQEWVRENLNFGIQMIFVSNNYGGNSFLDMQLMSLCKHNIIANSSFSWWGAWLNANSDKIVIAPKQWFADKDLNAITTDLLPTEWKKI